MGCILYIWCCIFNSKWGSRVVVWEVVVWVWLVNFSSSSSSNSSKEEGVVVLVVEVWCCFSYFCICICRCRVVGGGERGRGFWWERMDCWGRVSF